MIKKVDKKYSKPWRVRLQHGGKVQHFGQFATAEEAAWEHDLKRLELGYETEGSCNFRLQLGERVRQQQSRKLRRWM